MKTQLNILINSIIANVILILIYIQGCHTIKALLMAYLYISDGI